MNLLTAHELAVVLRVAPATVYARAKTRQLPCYRIGDRILFDCNEVLAALRVAPECEDFGNLKIGRRPA